MPGYGPAMTDVATFVRAFQGTWAGLADVCEELSEEQWAAATDLPGWSVQDNVSHVVAEELFLLGDPAPEHELPSDLPHLRSEFAREIELPIDFRRSWSGRAVLTELREVTARRLEVLRAYDEAQLDEERPFAGRTMRLRDVLGIRVFDCWIHEQDVRRAVGRPGGWDGPAAELAQARLVRALRDWTDEVPAAAGRTVLLAISGPHPSSTVLPLGGEHHADTPDVAIRTDAETFLRLTAGRAGYDQVADRVAIEGDEVLGAELCRHMAVTP